ncbi:MAG: hypothetical protein ACRDKT_01925 [Actinomycetota bacterium]
MGIKRVVKDLRDLRRGVSELFEQDTAAEEEASYQLAASARRFSQKSKEVVDDKLSFSATLMRAGEVQAANRLLEEVHDQVRTEEAALIENINEVKVAQTMRRERVTRLRLARMLAVATIGTALLTFSAAGMAIANFLRDRADQSRELVQSDAVRLATTDAPAAASGHINRKKLRGLRIGDVKVMLTKAELARLKELTGGGQLDEAGLEELLNSLPQPLADRIAEAITVAQTEVEAAAAEVEDVVAAQRIERKRRRAARAAAEAKESEQQEQPGTEPSPSPSPSESPSDGDEEGGDTSKDKEEGDTGGPPLPIKP